MYILEKRQVRPPFDHFAGQCRSTLPRRWWRNPLAWRCHAASVRSRPKHHQDVGGCGEMKLPQDIANPLSRPASGLVAALAQLWLHIHASMRAWKRDSHFVGWVDRLTIGHTSLASLSSSRGIQQSYLSDAGLAPIRGKRGAKGGPTLLTLTASLVILPRRNPYPRFSAQYCPIAVMGGGWVSRLKDCLLDGRINGHLDSVVARLTACTDSYNTSIRVAVRR